MTTPEIGCSVDELDTPAVLVDLDVLDANIGRIAAACRSNGVRWRPHMKRDRRVEVVWPVRARARTR